MLIIGLIMENSNKQKEICIINNSERKFKLFLDGKYVGLVNGNSKANTAVSCGSHSCVLSEVTPIKLLKFFVLIIMGLIENFVTQGCGDLGENISSLITKHDILISTDIDDNLILTVDNDLNICSTTKCRSICKKAANRKRAMLFFMIYILPIFILLSIAIATLLYMSIIIMLNGYVKQSLVLIGSAIAMLVIFGYVLYKSKKIKIITSIIKNKRKEVSIVYDRAD